LFVREGVGRGRERRKGGERGVHIARIVAQNREGE
jgi:hypothetical protein